MDGKVVLVTGASRGIGRATASLMAREGAVVVVNYNQSEEDALDLVQSLIAAGLKAEAVKADVSDEAQVNQMFKALKKKHGRLDVLVNNAGIVGNSLLLMTATTEFDRILKTNCRGAFLCLRSAAKIMTQQRSGSIINLTSIVGVHGNAGQIAYAASKSFIIGMTKSAAKELGAFNITVNAVAPGYIDTDLTKGLRSEVKDRLIADISLGRPGTPEDVAEAILFLASDQARYINGHILEVDGSQKL